MSSANTSAILPTPHPVVPGLPEKPNPGSDGATTWNASAASPPNLVGSVNGSMILWNSTIEPGQPWVMISGNGVLVGRANVDEVQVEVVDHGRELREPVQGRLPRPPVVAVRPVLAHVLDVRQRRALRPVLDELPLRPARRCEPSPEVVERLVAHRCVNGMISVSAIARLYEPELKHLGSGTKRFSGPCRRETPGA